MSSNSCRNGYQSGGKSPELIVIMNGIINVGYGVTANIAASHADRGSSGFDSPYPNFSSNFVNFFDTHRLLSSSVF